MTRARWAMAFLWGLLVGELATMLLVLWLHDRVELRYQPVRSCYQENAVTWAVIREGETR